MLTLDDINQAAPSYIRLLNKLAEQFPDSEFSIYLEKVKGFLDGSLDSEDKAALQEIFDQLGINVDADDVEKVYSHWKTLAAPISAFKELKNWSIDWDTSTVAGGSNDIEIKLAAKADTSVQVWDSSKAREQDIKISDSDVIVNHEVIGGYSASASTALSSGYATASFGIDHSREIEFDRFFQYQANTPTYRVMLNSFAGGVRIWDLNSVANELAPCINDSNCEGLRQLTLRTTGTFAFNASLEFGRAWSKTGDGQLKDVTASLNLKAGLTKTVEHKGGISISLSAPKLGNDGHSQVRAVVNLTEETNDALAFSVNANAEIKGLDQVAKKYIVPLFDDADELVTKLEEWSSPADKLISTITESNATDWYSPLVELVFGKSDSMQVYNQLISDELSSIVDRYVQDPRLDSTELANTAVDKLLETFGLDASNESVAEVAAGLSEKLSNQFSEWKSSVADEINEFIDSQGENVVTALAPLERLGVTVQSIAGQVDQVVSERVQFAVSQYQGFKEKVLDALEKSANIQIGLSLALEKKSSSARDHALVIDFVDADNPLSQSLFAALILGDNKKFIRLLDRAQQERVVEVPNESITANYSTGKSLSFSLDFAGFTVNSLQNINTQLTIHVDNTGNIMVVGSASAIAESNAFGESRKASMKLSYDLANALSDPNQFASYAINYKNKDSKRHSVGEMRDILEAMVLPDGDVSINSSPMIDIINPESIKSHLNWYTSQLNTQKFATSSVDIFIGDTAKLIKTLSGTNADFAFELAMDCVLELTQTEPCRKVIQIADACREARDLETVAQGLDYLGDTLRFKKSKTRNTIKKSNTYGDMLRLASDEAFGIYLTAAQRVYDKANAMEEIILLLQTTFGQVMQLVEKGLSPDEFEKQLSAMLRPVNKRLGDNLAEWTRVNNPLEDLLQGGIDKTLLSFFSVLLSLCDDPIGLVRVTLTLEDKSGNRVIRVIS